MRVAFLVGDIAGISGGSNVIIEHAHALERSGHAVEILTAQPVDPLALGWNPKARSLRYVPTGQAEGRFDFALATWWPTYFELHRVDARVYGYLNQSLESRFHDEPHYKLLNRLTYALPVLFITEAQWLVELIGRLQPDAPVKLVRNGLSREFFPCAEQPLPPAPDGRLRVLVEGPFGVRFKGVSEAFALLDRASASLPLDVGWLTSDAKDEEPEVGGRSVRVHTRVPLAEVHRVFAQYDLLLKLSRVEGMFGPPLEMFSQGGTAITSAVTGHEEYIVHGKNALVVPTYAEAKVADYLRALSTDPALLRRLKTHALETARAYPGWQETGAQLVRTLEDLRELSNAHLRPALAAVAASRGQWLEAVWKKVAPPPQPYIGPGEMALLERYRKLKASAPGRAVKALVPSGLKRRVRALLVKS